MQNDELMVVDEIEEEEAYITYDIATYPSDFRLSGIVEMWKEGDITIPDFQREYVWNIKQASLLIESFLLGLPVPSVFLYIDEHNRNLVIDGQQRILSIVFFFDGYFGTEEIQGKRSVFRLKGLSEKSPYHNKTFSELDPSEQRKLKGSVLRAINIRQLSPAKESTSVYHIFERLNTGGTPLKSQEIRNVVFRGEFVQILRELNKDPNWRLILGTQSFNKHQTDVELVLRVFSLRDGSDSYEKPMKEFLNQAIREHQNGDSDAVDQFRNRFGVITKKIIDELGEKPFHLRNRLNTSALDSVFCTLYNHYDEIPNDLAERYEKLKDDSAFGDFTSIGTTDTATVKQRFELVYKYLMD